MIETKRQEIELRRLYLWRKIDLNEAKMKAKGEIGLKIVNEKRLVSGESIGSFKRHFDECMDRDDRWDG